MSDVAAGPLGPFVLLEPLARGGMGEVWLARCFGLHNQSDDLVVVKLARADVAAPEDVRERFRDETRIALLLAHPAIARTVDAGQAGGLDYLALEAVTGLSLLHLVQRLRVAQQPMRPHVALFIVARVLDALAFAHGARHPRSGEPLGVVHRDLSPHNVMCAADGAVKLIDFGVALSSLKQAQTEQGIVIGKMSYMSPEQARGERPDARSDVFSAAMILYELLSAERYYPGMAPEQVWRIAGSGSHVPPRLARMDADIQRVLSRALMADRAQRTPTASMMCAEVMGLLMVRGGPLAAQGELASLVRVHGAPEVARFDHARALAAAASEPPPDPTTLSLAREDLDAVQAALAAQPDNAATLPPADAPLPRDTLMDVPPPPTLLIERRAAPQLEPPIGAARRRPWALIASLVAGALVLGVAATVALRPPAPGLIVAPGGPADAGEAPRTPPQRTPPPPTPSPPTPSPPAPSPPAPPLPPGGDAGALLSVENRVDAGVHRAAALAALIEGLRGCSATCVPTLTKAHQQGRITPKNLQVFEDEARRCAAVCKR